MAANELVDRSDAPRVVVVTSADGYGSGSIITPEAVVLDFELAGLASRSIAYALDFLVQILVLVGFLLVTSAISTGSPLFALIVLLVGLILIVLGYPTAMETFNGGRTLGRMVVKTRVVTVEGAPVRFRQAFIRALLGIVDLLMTAGTIAVVSTLVTRRGQRLGDLVAGTMVIREPKPRGTSNAVHFWAPSYLAEWSKTVDTRLLGNDAYQLVRDFLTRAELAEPARSQLAEEVADLVTERLPHTARPPTVPALDYLTAIATATQVGAQTQPPPPQAQAGFGVAANLPPPPGVVPSSAQPAPPRPVANDFSLPSIEPASAAEPPIAPAPNDSGFAAPG